MLVELEWEKLLTSCKMINMQKLSKVDMAMGVQVRLYHYFVLD